MVPSHGTFAPDRCGSCGTLGNSNPDRFPSWELQVCPGKGFLGNRSLPHVLCIPCLGVAGAKVARFPLVSVWERQRAAHGCAQMRCAWAALATSLGPYPGALKRSERLSPSLFPVVSHSGCCGSPCCPQEAVPSPAHTAPFPPWSPTCVGSPLPMVLIGTSPAPQGPQPAGGSH